MPVKTAEGFHALPVNHKALLSLCTAFKIVQIQFGFALDFQHFGAAAWFAVVHDVESEAFFVARACDVFGGDGEADAFALVVVELLTVFEFQVAVFDFKAAVAEVEGVAVANIGIGDVHFADDGAWIFFGNTRVFERDASGGVVGSAW